MGMERQDKMASIIKAKCLIDARTGCWIFQGNIDDHGYPRVSFEGRSYLAARVMAAQKAGVTLKEKFITHGLCGTRACCNPEHLKVTTNRLHWKTSEYRIWRNIRDRCLNPRCRVFPQYGGRGIGMAPEWQNDYFRFLQDMGPRPGMQTVERIDNGKGYSKENCRWASRKEQAQNRSTTVWIEAEGKRMTQQDWAKELGINHTSIRNQKEKLGSYQMAIQYFRDKSGSVSK